MLGQPQGLQSESKAQVAAAQPVLPLWWALPQQVPLLCAWTGRKNPTPKALVMLGMPPPTLALLHPHPELTFLAC